MKVKRYDLDYPDSWEMMESSDGDWVAYEDYEKLEAEVKEYKDVCRCIYSEFFREEIQGFSKSIEDAWKLGQKLHHEK